jgi:hypothetical protein
MSYWRWAQSRSKHVEGSNKHIIEEIVRQVGHLPELYEDARSEKNIYTGLFISPSGISDLCGTVTGMVTPKENMSTEGETLQVSVLPYKCSICPPLVTRQMSNLAIFANSKT